MKNNIPHLIRYAGILIILCSVIVITGWIIDIPLLTTAGYGLPSMKFNTALAFCLTGILILSHHSNTPRNIVSYLLLILAGASLFENLSNIDLGIDQLVVKDSENLQTPGLMSSGTSTNFLLFAIAFLYIKSEKINHQKIGQLLLAIVFAISLLAILGFLYGISNQERLTFISSMAIHTSLLFAISSAAASLINPHIGLIKFMYGDAPGNTLVRKMFPISFLSIAIVGYVLTSLLDEQFISGSTSIILFGLITLLVYLISISIIALRLNTTDYTRIEAENNLKKINTNLEQRIQDRTARLKQTLDLLQETNRVGKVGGWEMDMNLEKISWAPVTKMIYEVPADFTPSVLDIVNFYKKGESRGKISKAINDAISFRHSWDLELQIITKSGNTKWVRSIGKPIFEDGKCVRISGTIQDIDKLKNAELKTTQEREFLQTIIDNVPVNIYVKDLDSKKILANKSEARFLGASDSSEILGKDDFDFYPEDQAMEFKREDEKIFESGQPSLNIEKKVKRSNSPDVWLLISKIPLRNDNNEVSGILGVAVDITDRKNDEEKLKNYAVLQAKSKEMEEFAYIASHDLREPLLTIKNYLDLLLEDFGQQIVKIGDGDQYIKSIVKGVVRLDSLISSLLDYSRLSRVLEPETVDFNIVIEDLSQELHHLIESTGTSINVLNQLPVITAYPVLIKSLFQNLIANAIKFRKIDHAPVIQIGSKKESDAYIFTITDNGIGIQHKDLEQIFIIFRRLHRQDEYEGTGIGLAQCRRITELHNGRIWAESELGEGTTFYFTIRDL